MQHEEPCPRRASVRYAASVEHDAAADGEVVPVYAAAGRAKCVRMTPVIVQAAGMTALLASAITEREGNAVPRQPPPRSRALPLPPTPNRPGSDRYSRLIAELVKSSAAFSSGLDPLREAMTSLEAIIAFITSDKTLTTAPPIKPLSALHLAINDVLQGAAPTLFAKRQPDPTGPARPVGTSRDFAPAFLAATAEALYRQGGMRPREASSWLASECVRAGIKLKGGRKITSDWIDRRRLENNARSTPAAEWKLFDARVHEYRSRPNQETPDLQRAKLHAIHVINFLAAHIPELPPTASER